MAKDSEECQAQSCSTEGSLSEKKTRGHTKVLINGYLSQRSSRNYYTSLNFCLIGLFNPIKKTSAEVIIASFSQYLFRHNHVLTLLAQVLKCITELLSEIILFLL